MVGQCHFFLAESSIFLFPKISKSGDEFMLLSLTSGSLTMTSGRAEPGCDIEIKLDKFVGEI